MLCYKDKTFCVAPCATDCHRRYTATVAKEAKIWWGKASGAVPIALDNFASKCPAFKKDYNEIR